MNTGIIKPLKLLNGLRLSGFIAVVALGLIVPLKMTDAARKTPASSTANTATQQQTAQTKKSKKPKTTTTPSSGSTVTTNPNGTTTVTGTGTSLSPIIPPTTQTTGSSSTSTTPTQTSTTSPTTNNGTTTTAPATSATAAAAPKAKVSFTFDDGLASAYTQAQPTLAKYGLTGTDYVITGCVGMTTAPNTCHANTDAKYLSWTQVEALQTDGWEIGSHTVTHPYLASSDASDGQPNVLTPDQVTQELVQSRADLAAHGITATDFSSPYGDYTLPVLAQISKYYASHRGFADTNDNDSPYNDYLLNDYQVQEGVTVAQVEAKIDAAIANNQWLILTFHNIKANPSSNPDDYEYGTAELDQIAAYVKAKQSANMVSPVNINKGLVTSGVNMLVNSSFNDGIADGWSTDSPTTITADNGNNGSYPDPTNSIKLGSATTGNVHLFSPKVDVDASTLYTLKSFLNVQTIGSGEVAFYVDEYDADGNWVSGQYLKAENSVYVEELNFNYQPTSTAVKKASLQVIVAGTGISAYLDNTQWFPVGTVTPNPAPTPTTPPATPPTTMPPSPTATNLVTNGSFDDGIADGWTTDDPANVTADANNNGSPNNKTKSIRMISGTANNHLFSPKVSVDSTKQYSLSSYLNKPSAGGEVAFYIDEYDADGNWVSGQYKTGIQSANNGDVSFSYTPSSAKVATASLQVINVGGSGITAYVDDVRWYIN